MAVRRLLGPVVGAAVILVWTSVGVAAADSTAVQPNPPQDVQLPSPPSALLVASSKQILRLPLDGFTLKPGTPFTVVADSTSIRSIAFDCVDNMVYWMDSYRNTISRGPLNGGEPEVIVTGIVFPMGLAIDPLSRNVFWVDLFQKCIEVANLDGSQRQVLINGALKSPSSIAVDPELGRLYWVDWTSQVNAIIETAHTDGSGRRVLVNEDLPRPEFLTFDPNSRQLCWADTVAKRLECMEPNRGTHRLSLEVLQRPVGLTSFAGHLYYTDSQRQRVVSATLDEELGEYFLPLEARFRSITTVLPKCLTVPLPAPEHIRVKMMSSTLTEVTWQPVNVPLFRGSIMGYKASYWRCGVEDNLSPNVTLFPGLISKGYLTNLQPNTFYSLTVQVYNGTYEGPPSIAHHFDTFRGERVVEFCSGDGRPCSPKASCHSHPTGQCCSCNCGYYGDGHLCLSQGLPQRVTGEVRGRLFLGDSTSLQVDIFGAHLHVNAQVKDGRQHTNVTLTSVELLGWSLLPLFGLTDVTSWMFALERPGTENGFNITGGRFTRTADVTFLPRNESVSILQILEGVDEHGRLSMNTSIYGHLPITHPPYRVTVAEYEEVYHHRPNVLTSSSTREYTADFGHGRRETFQQRWRQKVTWNACPHGVRFHTMSTQRLSVKNIDASYDAGENVLRYASTSTISSATVENPCDDGSHDCDSDAHCLPLRGQGYACKCGVGSTGSERVCYENLPVDSCHTSTPGCDSTERARCISTGPTTLRCKCLPGFTGSGRVCLDINECWSNPCDRNAVCDNNAGSFSCHCESGFVGDGFKCLPAPDIPALLIGTSSQILRLPLDRFSFKPGTRPAVIADTSFLIGIAFDCVDNMVYWTDINEETITRVPLNGGEPEVIVTGVEFPMGLAIDHLGRNLFWTDIGRNCIEVAKLDGSQRRVLIDDDGLISPVSIAIDPEQGYLYWVDWDMVGAEIERAHLDGSERRTLVNQELEEPRGLTFDPYLRELCWVDAGIKWLVCMDPESGTRRYVVFNIDQPKSLTVLAGYLYYTDWHGKRVLYTSSNMQPAQYFLPQMSQFHTITTVVTQCHPGQNDCSRNNGGCTHLCLASPHGHTCR